jgi:hypothetical protein
LTSSALPPGTGRDDDNGESEYSYYSEESEEEEYLEKRASAGQQPDSGDSRVSGDKTTKHEQLASGSLLGDMKDDDSTPRQLAIGSEQRQIGEEETASEKESAEFSADWGDGESAEDTPIEQTESGEQAEDKKNETDDCNGSDRPPIVLASASSKKGVNSGMKFRCKVLTFLQQLTDEQSSAADSQLYRLDKKCRHFRKYNAGMCRKCLKAIDDCEVVFDFYGQWWDLETHAGQATMEAVNDSDRNGPDNITDSRRSSTPCGFGSKGTAVASDPEPQTGQANMVQAANASRRHGPDKVTASVRSRSRSRSRSRAADTHTSVCAGLWQRRTGPCES